MTYIFLPEDTCAVHYSLLDLLNHAGPPVLIHKTRVSNQQDMQQLEPRIVSFIYKTIVLILGLLYGQGIQGILQICDILN